MAKRFDGEEVDGRGELLAGELRVVEGGRGAHGVDEHYRGLGRVVRA